MTENPTDIRREIGILTEGAERARRTRRPSGSSAVAIDLAIDQAWAAAMFAASTRLARAEADPTNKVRSKP